MKEIKNYRPLAAVTFVVVLIIGAMNTGHPARAATGSAPVTVLNTAANPLPVSGSVTGTITGNVNVTNTPNVSISNTPTVTLDSNAANVVTLGGTPSVNVASGSISTTPPVATQFQNFRELSLAPQSEEVIPFELPIKITTLLVSSQNDLDVSLITTFQEQGTVGPGRLIVGHIPGDSQVHAINFGAAVGATGIHVFNPALLTHATFSGSAIGY